MAGSIVVEMDFNKETGEKKIRVKYDSDEDALAYEHEARHREIVELLVGKGVICAEDAGNVIVERATSTEAAPSTNPSSNSEPEAQKQSS